MRRIGLRAFGRVDGHLIGLFSMLDMRHWWCFFYCQWCWKEYSNTHRPGSGIRTYTLTACVAFTAERKYSPRNVNMDHWGSLTCSKTTGFISLTTFQLLPYPYHAHLQWYHEKIKQYSVMSRDKSRFLLSGKS